MTEIENKVSEDKIKTPASIETLKKVNASANYCFNCNRCDNVCPTALLGIFDPRLLINDLTFLTPEEALKNNNIWKCLTCGLCSVYCPMTKEETGVNFTQIIKDLRSLSLEYEPLREDMVECHHYREYSSLPYLMANDKIKIVNKLGFLDSTNLKIAEKGEVAYFMGCIPYMTGRAPCSHACPAEVDVQAYVSLIAEGKFQEAIDLIREKNPLPFLCGRICTEYCALNCNRQFIDDPLAIRVLKKFVSDWEANNPNLSKIKPVMQNKEKIAIIGAGPAGLSAAYFLALKGYKPTIFEKGNKVGGMVRYGVPQYRLSDEALERDIEFIKKMGVEIVLNKPLGPDFTLDDIKKEGYKAIFLATGLYVPRTLRLEGEDLPNVNNALDFLLERKYKFPKNKDEFKGKTFGIIGGGAVAIDVAETAIRLGATKVDLVDILSEDDLQLVLKDIHDAEWNLIQYHFKTSTANITKEPNKKLALNCYKIEWGKPDPKTGRRALNKVEGSEYKIIIDQIVIAIGQGLDLEPIIAAMGDQLKHDRGKILVDNVTYETSIPGVFAGGDIIPNPKMVAVIAIGHGREAAESIDRYLRGRDLKKGRINVDHLKRSPIPKKQINEEIRQKVNLVPGEERLNNFEEMEIGFTEEQAIEEANRCMNCNCCNSYDQMVDDFNDSIDSSGVMTCYYGEQPFEASKNAFNYLEIPKSVIGLLNQNDINPVVLADEKCCGHDLLWQGDYENFKKLAKYNVRLFKEAGVKTLVFSCAEGYYTWKHEYKNVFEGNDEFVFEVYHITEYILKEKLLENLTFPGFDKIKVTYHDPCRLGRMSNVFDAPREVLKLIPSVELIEMEDNSQDADCCGVSAYISCSEDSKLLQEKKIKQAIDTGAEYLITACPKCIAHLNCYVNEHKELKNKIQIIDLVSFLGKLLFLV
ncbi:MAG: heterodisulfide reductase-related iron-sulfur binding cluster [Candidatus Hermodarchaeota archaeon]